MPVLVECLLAGHTDCLNFLDGSQRRSHEVSVVADGDVASLFKLKGCVDCHLLAGSLSKGLGPLDLARVASHLVVLAAFAATEPEALGLMSKALVSISKHLVFHREHDACQCPLESAHLPCRRSARTLSHAPGIRLKNKRSTFRASLCRFSTFANRQGVDKV